MLSVVNKYLLSFFLVLITLLYGFLFLRNTIENNQNEVLGYTIQDQKKIGKLESEYLKHKQAPKKSLYEQYLKSKEAQNINQDIVTTSDSNNLQDEYRSDCQGEQVRYNSCLIKYNADMLEYQNCRSEGRSFGCSFQPNNTCEINISSLCRNEVLGYY